MSTKQRGPVLLTIILSLSILIIPAPSSLLPPPVMIMTAKAWYNGPWTTDIEDPGYSTHDWIAEHALDWLPGPEKVYMVHNLGRYLYGTEIPDREIQNGQPVKYGHSTLFYLDGTILNKENHAGVGASDYYNQTKAALAAGRFDRAAQNAGIMTHYMADVSVWAHATNWEVRDWWGMETPDIHRGYESYVEESTRTYVSPKWEPYLEFDGALDQISAHDATVKVAWNATAGENGRFNCTWMNTTANDWNNTDFVDRTGRLLNLAVNAIADVLHTLALEMGYGTTVVDPVPIKVNEFDQNPTGDDTGNEWVELYNPTEEDMDLSYWFLENGQGAIHAFPKGTNIRSKKWLTLTMSKEWLDNEGESLALYTSHEDIVDQTPWLTDQHDDQRSWARVPNGHDTDTFYDWVFGQPTKNQSNPTPPQGENPPVPVMSLQPNEGDTSVYFKADGSASFDVDGTIIEYEWDWGDDTAPDTGAKVGHKYQEPGVFKVRLTVRDNEGLVNQTYGHLRVYAEPDPGNGTVEPAPNLPPVALIEASEPIVMVDDRITFTANMSFDPDGNISLYLFDLGDGVDSGWTEEDFVHYRYSEPGDYEVTVTVMDNGSAANTSDPVVIRVIPLPGVNHPPSLYIDQIPKWVYVHQDLALYIVAEDPDDDPVQISMVQCPKGMRITNARNIRWKPTEDQIGYHTIIIKAFDGHVDTISEFDLVVVEEPDWPETPDPPPKDLPTQEATASSRLMDAVILAMTLVMIAVIMVAILLGASGHRVGKDERARRRERLQRRYERKRRSRPGGGRRAGRRFR